MVGVFAIVMAAVGVAAFRSGMAPLVPAPTPSNAACAPAPCATIRGYDLWVTDIAITTGSARLMVSFRNSSSSTHADPSDFSLIEASGHPDRPVYDSSACSHWPRTEFQHGERRGPLPLCFQPTSVAPPLRLQWEPDFGFACCQTEIRIA